MSKTLCRILSLAAIAAALPAAAQVSPWYAGISVGEARTGSELVRNRESTITNAIDVQTGFDDRDTAWKLTAGYRFHPNFAVELDYADLGKSTMDSRMLASDLTPVSILIHREISGFGADLVAGAPLGDAFSIFGRVGAFRSSLEADATLEGFVVFNPGDPSERQRSVKRKETVLRYGLGAEWRFLRNAAVRLEWERYNDIGKAFEIGGTGTTGEADVGVFSLGVMMSF